MKKPEHIQKEIKKTLKLADEILAQEAPSYLYARLMQKMQSPAFSQDTFRWSPAWRWALAGFCLLFVLNVGSLAWEWTNYGNQKYEVLADRYYGEPSSFYDFIDE